MPSREHCMYSAIHCPHRSYRNQQRPTCHSSGAAVTQTAISTLNDIDQAEHKQNYQDPRVLPEQFPGLGTVCQVLYVDPPYQKIPSEGNTWPEVTNMIFNLKTSSSVDRWNNRLTILVSTEVKSTVNCLIFFSPSEHLDKENQIQGYIDATKGL
jgi:hypothetical protein